MYVQIYISKYQNCEILVCFFLPKCNINTNTPLTKKKTELPILPLHLQQKQGKSKFFEGYDVFSIKKSTQKRRNLTFQATTLAPNKKIHITPSN